MGGPPGSLRGAQVGAGDAEGRLSTLPGVGEEVLRDPLGAALPVFTPFCWCLGQVLCPPTLPIAPWSPASPAGATGPSWGGGEGRGPHRSLLLTGGSGETQRLSAGELRGPSQRGLALPPPGYPEPPSSALGARHTLKTSCSSGEPPPTGFTFKTP